MIWLLIGYMWLFIHRPFEEWTWLGTYRIERLYMLLVVACWAVSGPRLPRWNRIHGAFALFLLALLASWCFSPYRAFGTDILVEYLKYAVFYVLVVTSVRDKRGLSLLLAGYSFIFVLVMIHSIREFFSGRVLWAQDVHRMPGVGVTFSDPNDFAAMIVLSLPIAAVLSRQWKLNWKQVIVIAHVLLSCFCITRTGSRMGFIGLAVAGLLAVAVSRYRWRLLVISPIIVMAGWAFIPPEIRARYHTLIDPHHGSESAIASMGNYRSDGFNRGLAVFREFPILGAGPKSIVMFSATGHRAHNTYGELLGELGLFGAVAFGAISFAVIRNWFEARSIARTMGPEEDRLAWNVVCAASVTFVLLLTMGWGLHLLFWHSWLWLGAIMAVSMQVFQDSYVNEGQRVDEASVEGDAVAYAAR